MPPAATRSVPDAATTTRWARTLLHSLAEAGLRELALAPGSRSTPLVMAAATSGDIRCRVHLDERSCAFFALGVGKASQRPAAVLTTSGTAVANLYPAVVEAAKAEVPLVVLTADRPHHLRDADANQAIDQLRPFGPYPLASWEVAPPSSQEAALRHVQALGRRAVAVATGPPAGPVHLNFPFDEPLVPAEGPADEPVSPLSDPGRRSAQHVIRTTFPLSSVEGGRLGATRDTLARLAETIDDAERGVVVAGPSPEPGRLGPAVRVLAAATGFPVIADPLSGARYGEPETLTAHDLYLRDGSVAADLAPSLVLRVGASPTSRPVIAWLERHRGTRNVVVDGGRSWKDHASTATDYVRADAADTLLALTEQVERGSSHGARGEWRDRWLLAEMAARAVLEREASEGEPHEGWIAKSLVDHLPAGAVLVASSSMPVRDVDAYGGCRATPLTVLGNRGASGIDGIVSTAFGIAAASGCPTVCLIGDIALFHDQNGLLWSREDEVPVVFVLADNDGGGIFHSLPIAAHEPEFTRFFATPHGLDLGHAAAMHHIDFRTVPVPEVGEEAARALADGRTAIVRVALDRERDRRRRAEVASAVGLAVREALDTNA